MKIKVYYDGRTEFEYNDTYESLSMEKVVHIAVNIQNENYNFVFKSLNNKDKIKVLINLCHYNNKKSLDLVFENFKETVNLLFTSCDFISVVNKDFEIEGFQYLYKKWKSEKDKKWLLENLSDATRDKKLTSKRML